MPRSQPSIARLSALGLISLIAAMLFVTAPALGSRPVPGARYEGVYSQVPQDFRLVGTPEGQPEFDDANLDLLRRVLSGKTNVPGVSPPVAFQVSRDGRRAGFQADFEVSRVVSPNDNDLEADFVEPRESTLIRLFDAAGPADDVRIRRNGRIVGNFAGTDLFLIGLSGELQLPGQPEPLPIVDGFVSDDGDTWGGSVAILKGSFYNEKTIGRVRARRPRVQFLYGTMGVIVRVNLPGNAEPTTYASGDGTFGFFPFAGPACTVLRKGERERQAKCRRDAASTAKGKARGRSVAARTAAAGRRPGTLFKRRVTRGRVQPSTALPARLLDRISDVPWAW